MKKILLSALVLLVSTLSTIQAQNHNFISLGAKAGVNVNGVDEYQGISGNLTLGLTAGLFVEVRPTSLLGLSAELLYSERGFQLEQKSLDIMPGVSLGEFKMDQKIQYVDIPLMAKFYILGGLSANIGIMPSIILGAQGDATVGSLLGNGENKSAFHDVHFSIPVGVSYQLTRNLNVDARFIIPVSETNKVSGSIESIKVNTFSVSVGYKLFAL